MNIAETAARGNLQHHWDSAYQFEYDKTPGNPEPFRVRSRDDPSRLLAADTPDSPGRLIGEDYQSDPVSREVAP